ncbi:alpha/beta fold hydrolase [Rhodoferax fermentans]|uniref:Alpha/beta hydrolase n=1 Tax=Rhodoferax fermentans TaxID=28066 RepID=A0A1T1AWL2_RHOFE|nr:alpha/beta hydrolase [Rhodoferax fermentans]MBK1684855.1 alpha/beta hydrolase [Rhodoferax fermentans]OOV08447.1 alpha/beta hydrolase [Rhodoferax fermentans]
MYAIQNIPRSHFVPIRTLSYHVRLWGQPQPGQTPLVLLHGWMDVGASFQFVVDALAQDHFIIAPDWRGFGLTASNGADSFWYPDYLADLDALLDHFSPNDPVHLVGHSMGANIAMLYAGIRPARVRRLVNLEGFGLPATQPEQATERFTQWLDQLKVPHATQLKTYPSLDAVAARLIKNNPRLSPDKAQWLAGHWSVEATPGHWQILAEAAHKLTNPQLYRVDEVASVHRQITAPTLMVEAEDDGIALFWKGKFTLAEHRQRLQAVPDIRVQVLPDCGHMLHHDQPQAVAALIEAFLR